MLFLRCPAGGRDTAGLGGRGGPYRLDAGHKVHQVSQAEKDAVPEEIRKAAREMGAKAFKDRYSVCVRVCECVSTHAGKKELAGV